MSRASENLSEAMRLGMSLRPKVGGFPFLAETLRSAGVLKNIWSLPSCQSLYVLKEGSVVSQGHPLVTGMHDVPIFDEAALIRALRKDQAGEGSFPEFLSSTWQAGVVSYEVDFINRKVHYYGASGECYAETYPAVEIAR
jgi:uncharacterized protein YbcV (DUF1398 family)